MEIAFNGIQQLGVGVVNLDEGWAWYRKYFGMDICVFEEAAIANLMLKHTENKPRARHAVLALNMEGGGGFEVWQHTGKKPVPATFEVQLGDLGICVGKVKSRDIKNAYAYFKSEGLQLLGEIQNDPAGQQHFFVKDLYQYTWQVIQKPEVLVPQKSVTGGIAGATIGVKDLEQSFVVYKEILGYTDVIYDEEGIFEDLKGLREGSQTFRRVLLRQPFASNGAFSRFFGPSEIELVQAVDREPKDIFEGRIWGDPGFIHICFDINGMDALRNLVEDKGYPFTVDSAKAMDTFDMGEAAGNFSYIQAPEGTLIEFVETHKVPMLKKIGWYLDLRKRGRKPLPNWMLRLFALKRVKS